MITKIIKLIVTPIIRSDDLWSFPRDGSPVDVGKMATAVCITVCAGIAVQEMMRVDVSKAVDVFAVCVNVHKVLVVTSEQEVTDGSKAGILSNDPT